MHAHDELSGPHGRKLSGRPHVAMRIGGGKLQHWVADGHCAGIHNSRDRRVFRPPRTVASRQRLELSMLWLKAFHIAFVVTWFAGLFYLPRLFVYHATATDAAGLERFVMMERRLFAMMTIGATLAVLFGLSMIVAAPGYAQMNWLRLKLLFVAGLVGYHVWCYALMQELKAGKMRRSQRWLRIFNEVPALFLLAIVILAVVKPF
jgi:putative membrane protein